MNRATRARRSEIRRILDEAAPNEETVLGLLSRPNTPSAMIEELMSRPDWAQNRKVRCAVARHPRTPLSLALQQLKFIGTLELLEITGDVRISSVLRKKVEDFLVEKLPGQPLGVKKAMAKLGRGEILLRLLEEDQPELTHLCLNNPSMTEGQVYRIVFHEKTSVTAIRFIASHRKWRLRYNIRLALLRNAHMPLQDAVNTLPDLKTADLIDALDDQRVHAAVKIHIRQQLDLRRVSPAKGEAAYEVEIENFPDTESGESANENGGDIEGNSGRGG